MAVQRAATLAALAASAAAQASLPVTLQRCAAVPGAQFTLGAGGTVVDGSGNCLTSSGGNLVGAPCSTGDATQAFTWHADGTVSSNADRSLCWNADGGATAINTTIILYSCGSSGAPALAANDVFAYLAASKNILANESGLCLSTQYVPPPPPGSCTSDLDCSLNGVCAANGQCVCDAPWTASPDCGAMAFQPAPLQRGYGWNPADNVTSWGGSVSYWEGDGLYHMFVAEMVNGCNLNYWGRNSQVSHALSPTPLGPFTFSDVAIPVWSHNPAVVVANYPNGSQLWALFHIGGGNGGNPANCSSSSDVAEVAADGAAAVSGPAASSVHVSWTGPYGPFIPTQPDLLPSCNNPAPTLLRNGTWAIVCDGTQLYTAPSAYGPWTHVSTVRWGGGVPGVYEDPFLWQDARGNFHVIYHVYNTGADSTVCTPGHMGAIVGGHVFSRDGLTWQAASTAPYDNTVKLVDGSVQLLSTRERPKLLFNATTGAPTHLYNGVCYGVSTCPPTPCVNCKYDFADATNVVALQF